MRQTDPALTWLPFLPQPLPPDADSPQKAAHAELLQAQKTIKSLPRITISVDPAMGDGFILAERDGVLRLTGGETGVLYGAYQAMMAAYAEEALPLGENRPAYALRMLNCWDNAEGTVERGYSGRSLFFEGGHFAYDPVRIRQLGRMLASAGINVLCINNVNVHDPAHKLIEREWLLQLADLAALFRPFGVKLMLSIDYAHPLRDGLHTADPLDITGQQAYDYRKQQANATSQQ